MKDSIARWFILLVFYFTFFVVITAVADNTTIDDYIVVENEILVQGQCTPPRFAIFPDGQEDEITDKAFMRKCRLHTRGTFDETQCDIIPGCEYKEEVSRWYWFDQSEGCYGQMDIFQLNNNQTVFFPQFTSMCELENVISDPEMCHAVGCTWDETIEQGALVIPRTPTSLFRTVGDLFTFQYDFGFSGLANFLLIFILFYIPFLMILLCGYLLLPFLH